MSWFKREPKSVTLVVYTTRGDEVFSGDIYFHRDPAGDLQIRRMKPNGDACTEALFRRRFWRYVKQISVNA